MGAIDALVLADACPACDPGVPDAALPVDDPEPANGGTIATYECRTCGTPWRTWFDAYGWPVDRAIAPVSPEEAQRNRDELAAALKQSARENRDARSAGWPVSREAAA